MQNLRGKQSVVWAIGKQSILNFDIYIAGYEIVRRDRNRNGGGVCFYFKTAINCSVRTHLNINNLENLCLEIRKPNSKPFGIVTWYRLTNSPIKYSHLSGSPMVLGMQYNRVFNFRYTVFLCSKLGINYSLTTNFGYKVYCGFLNFGILQEFQYNFWYIGRFISGILVFHYPPILP